MLTAVDGTELTALAGLIEAGWQGRAVKLHTHFEPLKGVPADMDLTAADASEVDHLLSHGTNGIQIQVYLAIQPRRRRQLNWP